MRLFFLIFTVFLFFNISAKAQLYAGWEDGYIVMESGDTIYGSLKDFDLPNSCRKLILEDSRGERINYSKEPVASYKKGVDFFVKNSVPSVVTVPDLGPRFLHLVCNGKVNLYRSYHRVVNSTGTSTISMKDYLEKDGVFAAINLIGGRKTMMEYFSDDEDLVHRLKKRKLGHMPLEVIVNIYNKYN